MKPPPRHWPDGRPVGGEHGYPPEYAAWNHECQCRYVARRLAGIREQSSREAEIKHWQKALPHLDTQRVSRLVAVLRDKARQRRQR